MQEDSIDAGQLLITVYYTFAQEATRGKQLIKIIAYY
jgi:hypothetical protein